MKNQFYLLVCFIVLTPSVFWARHIVGGEITYKLKSTTPTTNTFEFTMLIYRDCNSVGGSPFDEVAPIGVYLKNAGRLTNRTSVPLGNIRQLAAPTIECLIPPNVCVEEGVYIWQMTLSKATDSYVILYQRCCRNQTLSNINNPGSVGATYTVEITQTAQERGNDSPTFKSFPPTVICGNVPLKFDHSAIDSEGYQLVYSFCEP